jgi:hypothetical protein
MPEDPSTGMSTPDNPTTDVDGAAAKKHGDYFVDVGDYASAVGYYKEALAKGDLSGTDIDKVEYNLASCYYHLGDQTSCYPHAYAASKSTDPQIEGWALKYFFWAVTGETLAGM